MEVPSPFSIIFSLLIIIVLFKLVIKSKRKTKSILPPGPLKLPILGNLLQLAGKIPHHGLRELAKKYGPLMHLQLGEISAVVVSNPRFAKEVLRTHDLRFADRPEFLVGTILFANCRDIVLARYGDYWRQMRKFCAIELLGSNKVRSFRGIREDETWQLIQSIKSSSSGSPVNISTKFCQLTNAITCRSTVGEKCKYQDELIELIDEISNYGSGFFMADLFPSVKFLPWLTGMKPALKRIRGKMDVIFDYTIKERTERLNTRKEGTEGEYLIDILLKINESQRLEFPISYGDIQGIVMDVFLAGTETSSTVLEWAMSELMKHPRVMKKVQSEIREVVKGKERVEETDIQKMCYFKLVIKETLRLHAPIPLILPRECREECEVGGYTIPVGTKVIINAWAIGRDPESWFDSESFIPERFENSSIDYAGADFEYIPFGAGRRMCAGISFGVATVELPLAQLLYTFDWKLPNEMEPEDLDMDEKNATTSKKKNNLYVLAVDYSVEAGNQE